MARGSKLPHMAIISHALKGIDMNRIMKMFEGSGNNEVTYSSASGFVVMKTTSITTCVIPVKMVTTLTTSHSTSHLGLLEFFKQYISEKWKKCF